jgi:hypothetical protein
MGESSHSVECTRTQSQDDATVDAPSAPAEKACPDYACGQTTVEDFYREGMGVAGKE